VSVATLEPTINDSAFEDLGKTLGELIDKYGEVTEIKEWDGIVNLLCFSTTPIKFCVHILDYNDLSRTTFTEDELNIKTTGSLAAKISDVFPAIQSTITDKEFRDMYNLDFESSEGTIYIEHNKYSMYIYTPELGKINPEHNIHVKLTDN
jgi:hypothetical protein